MQLVYMVMHLPYIGNFLRGFNFCWVRDLPKIAKNEHSEKWTVLYVFIESPWNSKNRTQWKFNAPSKRHFFAKISRHKKFPIYSILVHDDKYSLISIWPYVMYVLLDIYTNLVSDNFHKLNFFIWLGNIYFEHWSCNLYRLVHSMTSIRHSLLPVT